MPDGLTSRLCGRCGSTLPVQMDACPGCLLSADAPTVLGGVLELGEPLGRGGMGQVFRARHLRLQRDVAVKLLPVELAQRADLRERFEREARALAKLNHPNIVTIHDIGGQDDAPYLVMELVDGGSLAERLPLPSPEAVEIVAQVAAALQYAHQQGIIHRDVKPSNILIDQAGRARLGDFGLVASMAGGFADPAVTAIGQVLGTPHYMAPEALAGATPDARADIYSLGVVLYEAISGHLPMGDFEPLPGGLDRIVRRALAPDPARRIGSAAELRAELLAWTTSADSPLARASAGPSTDRAPVPAGRLSEGMADGDAEVVEEQIYIWAVALVQVVATAVALWAFLVSMTPRVLVPGELMPLVMVGTETLADGRLVSQARFETGETLAAVVALALAAICLALLRARWRRLGLDHPQPLTPIRETRTVLRLGVLACALYLANLLLQAAGWSRLAGYIPVFGGILEVTALFFGWVALLRMWRGGRLPQHELRLWIGAVLVLIPPVVELFRYVAAWKP